MTDAATETSPPTGPGKHIQRPAQVPLSRRRDSALRALQRVVPERLATISANGGERLRTMLRGCFTTSFSYRLAVLKTARFSGRTTRSIRGSAAPKSLRPVTIVMQRPGRSGLARLSFGMALADERQRQIGVSL